MQPNMLRCAAKLRSVLKRLLIRTRCFY
ncbi:Protein of unknown function [Pyronema omphalodes CBS 100304]|uniref:Uncharacterized protein n=1 Tax=Pyronema omphalodes (strain CBS 100304) TaxID=1076935 RepID=U4L850_PYROM|nr:Protein of unknown function [Pyronema omphalodes CBS 100304]